MSETGNTLEIKSHGDIDEWRLETLMNGLEFLKLSITGFIITALRPLSSFVPSGVTRETRFDSKSSGDEDPGLLH